MAPPAGLTWMMRVAPTVLVLLAPLPRTSSVPASRMSWVVAVVGATPKLLPRVIDSTLSNAPPVALAALLPVTVQAAGLAAVPRPVLPAVVASEKIPGPVLVSFTPAAPPISTVLATLVVPPLVVISEPVLSVRVPLVALESV